MAPQKRSRGGPDGVEVIAEESATLSLRHEAQRKRARISDIGSDIRRRTPSTPSSDEEEYQSANDDGDALEAHSKDLQPASQYELLRDDGYKHLMNEDRDDQRATQRFLSRNQQIGDNHAAENAIIEEITCINFMCHDKLHVVVGPLINFIVGENGSGKSAVLTAITLCLGGKAASTNRGTSMKNLVKTGTDQAVLIIKLKNQGNDAYQPDLFGESIIIERHFSSTGSGSYKVKSATGRIISNRKNDVEDIVEYFQLQVDNPMNVLTQDAAKSFITKATPKDKYDFFNKGVQLAELDKDYKIVCETCDSIEVKLGDSKKDIKTLEKLVEAARVKSEMAQRHDGMRQQAKNLSKQAAWAQVEEQERRLADKETKVHTAQENIERQERTIEDKDIAYQRTDELWEHAKVAEKRVSEEVEPLKESLETAKAAFEHATQELFKAHAQSREISQRMKEDKAKVTAIKRAVQAEVARIEELNGGSHTRKLAELGEAEQAVLDVKAARTENENEAPQLQERLRILQNELEKADRALTTKRNEVKDAQARLSNLKRDRGDPMKSFHQNLPGLLRRIQNDNGFRDRPIGPLGLHIKLLNPIWSNIIEKTIGGNLNGFAVTSKSDQVRLSGLMQQSNLQLPILIGNARPIDTSRHEPDPQYDTILRVLEIKNDLIRNQLIINHGIEQSLLINRLEDAEHVMYQVRPQNAKQCFVINHGKRGFGHRLGNAGKTGNGRDLTPVMPPKGQPRMQTDVESQIQYQKDTVDGLEKEVAELETKKRQAQLSVNSVKQEITRNNRTSDKLRLDIQRAEEQVDALKAELDQHNVEDGRLDALKEDLKEAEQTVAIDEDSYGNLGVEKDSLNQISTEKKKDLDVVKLHMEDYDAKVRKAQKKTRNVEEARKIALQDKNNAIRILEELSGLKEKLEQSRNAQLAKTADYMQNASAICARVPVDPGETLESIEPKLKKLLDQLKKYQRQQGATDEEIHEAYVAANERWQRANQYQEELTELLDILKQAFIKRLDMFRRFQQFISARSRINFNYLLSERAFRGKLTIDHKARELEVHVEPDETSKSSKGRQTKTLSGGEKSFSNICLLLSLWEAMGAPLRCLDEFDVFMDQVNRDVSSKMIISAARRSVGRQFILITPQGLGKGVEVGEDVKITRLFDPRKKQRRIDDMVNGKKD